MSDTPVTAVIRTKKAVVFDLFHTLTSVESSWGDNLPSTSEFLGVDRKAWNEQLLARSRERLTGLKTDPAAIIGDMAHAIDPSVPDALIRAAAEARTARFAAAVTDIPAEAVAALEALKAQGKLLGLVTNADVMEIAAWEQSSIRHLFDSTVVSCRVGLVKPEREIYELALRELGVSAAEAVFVGDGGSGELQGARDVGMTAIMMAGIIRKLWPDQIEARRGQADFVIERLSELVDGTKGDDQGVGAEAGFVLFDWGNTLMVDFPEHEGPMSSWPRVEAVTHARETLEQVRALGWGTALATNAGDSVETDIRAALARVELDPLIDRVFCSREVAHNKPSPEFFAFIKKALALPDEDLVMVGDDFQKDIKGATRCGIRAVWFRPGRWPGAPAARPTAHERAPAGESQSGAPPAPQSGAEWRTIADLLELPGVLQTWRDRI